MRPVSLILLAILAICLTAQSPIGMGPGALIDTLDWFSLAPSGCTPGGAVMCVGTTPYGDTNYFSAWLSDASQLPITTGLPIVGQLNDGASTNCSGNIAILQLAAFDWANKAASKIVEINCMASYGSQSGSNSPAGWLGHCTSGDDGVSNPCSWKSRTPLAKGGLLYLPVERQIASGTPSAHDATLIVSADGGKTWKNPYTWAHSGAASATGDAPLCGAASSSSGNPCADTSYAGSILWPNVPASNNGAPLYNWMFFQFGQDGSLPSTGDACNPATYTCAMLGDGSIGRSLASNMATRLQASDWQYFAGFSSGQPAWTSTFSSRKTVLTFAAVGSTDAARSEFILSAPSYIAQLGGYVLLAANYGNGTHRLDWLASRDPLGPYRMMWSGVCTPNADSQCVGTPTPVLALTAADGAGCVNVTVSTDYKGGFGDPHNTSGNPFFRRFQVCRGRSTWGPIYDDTGMYRLHAGWTFGSGSIAGTFQRTGLLAAFDFMDSGGVTSSGYQFFDDIANGSMSLLTCWNDGGARCSMEKGNALLSSGYKASSGYSAHLESLSSKFDYVSKTVTTAGNINAPSAMTGDGTFTVAGVYRFDASAYNSVWAAGDTNTSLAHSVGLSMTSAGKLIMEWGSQFQFKYAATSAFGPTVSQWYFVSASVSTGGATKLWTGVNGVLVDELAGISRIPTPSGGSPTQTPAVTAAPLFLAGNAAGSANVSYAGLWIYNHALSYVESQMLYQAARGKMLERGITVQ